MSGNPARNQSINRPEEDEPADEIGTIRERKELAAPKG
jgi:hypothetical protein